MSRRNLTKSDREVIARGSNKGDNSTVSGGSEVDPIEELKRSDSIDTLRAHSSSIKGKETVRFKDEEDAEVPVFGVEVEEGIDTEEKGLKELEEECRNDWWMFAENNTKRCSQRTLLRWNEFQFKSHRDLHLEGAKDWGAYRNDIMYALQDIGYTPGLKPLKMDKLKFGSIIRRTVKDGLRGIIEDISDGELMTQRLGQSYRQTGAIQAENFFGVLYEVKYDKRNPLDYVTDFRRAVRDARSTKLELPDGIC